jgi:hypothetical protein
MKVALLFSALLLFLSSAKGGTPAGDGAQSSPRTSAGLLNDVLLLRDDSFKAWNIGGQLRGRYELKDDAGSFPDRDFIRRGVDNDNDYLLLREKLHIGWQPESWLSFFVEGRGAQAVSDDRDASPEQDGWDLHQGYFKLGDPKIFPMTLQVGRQEMLYGDEHLIGIGDWGNTGRSFDAVRLRATLGETSWVDVFTSRVVIARDEHFNESNDEDQFSGIYAFSQELAAGLDTQAYFLARNVGEGSPNAIARGIGGPSERDVYTYGVRVKSLVGALHSWDFTAEGLGQFGNVVTGGVDRDLRSYAFFGNFGYTFERAWGQPRLGLGYDHGSGDSDPKDGKQQTFEQLFGTNHAYYGVMDLVGPRNIQSPRVSFGLKPGKKLTLSLDYILFWLADTHDFFYPESGPARTQNGYGRNPQFDSFVGSELDLVAKYAVTPWASVHMGYGHFFPGAYIKSSVASVPANGGATGADWFYVQTTVNF